MQQRVAQPELLSTGTVGVTEVMKHMELIRKELNLTYPKRVDELTKVMVPLIDCVLCGAVIA